MAPWLMGMFLLTRPNDAAWYLCLVLGLVASLGFIVLGQVDRMKNLSRVTR